ncbi:MAG: nickel-dependent lactate racemase, partial [Pygmaiobacter sp.]|nr:nickel-dependent lactate racemase [Pygmaiobacter sp.]
MFETRLKYGDGEVAVRLKGAKSVTLLNEKEMAPLNDLADAFLHAVESDCIGSPPLRDVISPADPVTIVISDITRFWMRQDRVVSLLVDYLHEKVGVPYEGMVILVALGTHRPQTDAELMRLVTPRIFNLVKVINHNCDADDLAFAGTTPLGTGVWVNPLAVGRKVIVISGTMHHLMAGYGGGRKSLVPGIAGKKTINQNHLHSLSPTLPRSNPLIGMGVLKNNPVNEDMNAAAALVNPVFGISIVVNSQNEHCALVCGNLQAAWEKSCALVDAAMAVPIEKKADAVVVSCGGYPKDINLYQAVKSLLNAAQALKEGGLLVFLAECR